MNTDKRKEILKAAEELIGTFGYRKTALIDIAKKAGMSKSAMYYYFDSKASILEEVIKKDLQAFRAKLEPIKSLMISPTKKLVKVIITRVCHLSLLKNSYSTLADEYLENYKFVQKAQDDFCSFEQNLILDILNQGIESGDFRSDIPLHYPKTISIAMKGLEKVLLLDNHQDIEKVSRNFALLLIEGLKK